MTCVRGSVIQGFPYLCVRVSTGARLETELGIIVGILASRHTQWIPA